jgi:hypothetical protein
MKASRSGSRRRCRIPPGELLPVSFEPRSPVEEKRQREWKKVLKQRQATVEKLRDLCDPNAERLPGVE